ncbi:hypothetical protein V6S67_03580 [Arthrobacter sp. Soc17.1.1.1]|uniref:hypothetical protein n=1 Tax=Arthrobacter sp. Soc17.1.1.1 TaxID=3121277 RepID=UPI002FE47169
MDGDLLLHWLSSREKDSFGTAITAIAAMAEGTAQARHKAAWTCLRGMEELGHLDLLRAESRWCIRPTTITQLPGPAALALIIGRRTPDLEAHLDDAAALHRIDPAPSGAVSSGRPSTLLLEYDSEADLEQIATRAGALFVSCIATARAGKLEPLAPGLRTAGPNQHGSQIDRYSVRARRFETAGTMRENGLFRQLVHGRNQYWIHRAGEWFSTTHAEGVCLSLKGDGTSYLRFLDAEGTGDPAGTLRVDPALVLPVRCRQVLTLCSGVSPAYTADRAWMYHNVPLSVAAAVARCVHQSLRVP